MYLIVGATGNVGSHVVDQLLAAGKRVRVFTRDASKVASLGDRVEVAIGDLSHPGTLAHAFAGVEAAFLMNGVLDINLFGEILATAKATGKPRIVFLSTLFATDPESAIGQVHKQKEDAILASGLHGTFIRAGNFMTNTFQWLDTIKGEGSVYNAMGEGKTAPIAPEDIAAVAAYALTNPGESGAAYDVTGGELLTLPEQVSVLAKVLGKPIRAVEITAEQAREGLLRAGFPPFVAGAVSQTYGDIAQGKVAYVRDTVERIKGSAPVSYEAWVKQNANRLA